MSNNYGYCPTGNVTDISNVCDIDNLLAEAYNNGPLIYALCDSTGKVCNSGCESAIAPILSHSCMTSDAADFVTDIVQYYDTEFVQMVLSCGEKPTAVAGDNTVSDEVCPDSAVSVGAHFVQLSLTVAIALKYSF